VLRPRTNTETPYDGTIYCCDTAEWYTAVQWRVARRCQIEFTRARFVNKRAVNEHRPLDAVNDDDHCPIELYATARGGGGEADRKRIHTSGSPTSLPTKRVAKSMSKHRPWLQTISHKSTAVNPAFLVMCRRSVCNTLYLSRAYYTWWSLHTGPAAKTACGLRSSQSILPVAACLFAFRHLRSESVPTGRCAAGIHIYTPKNALYMANESLWVVLLRCRWWTLCKRN